MPRFNLRQLLLATTLSGVGMGMIMFGAGGISRARDFALLPVLFISAGCAAMGLGARVLFRWPVIGFLVSMTLFFCIMVYYGRR